MYQRIEFDILPKNSCVCGIGLFCLPLFLFLISIIWPIYRHWPFRDPMCETDFYQIPKDINEIIYPQVNDTDGQYDLRMPSVAQADYSIRDVWQSNLEQEFRTIRQIVQTYKYVAMDTEFPGVVARPIGEFRSNADYHYQQLRCNVDLLKIIQVGMTFLNDYGQTPTPISTWQFNFKFNLTVDMYAQESIDLLVDSGIQFKKHEEEGINTDDFAELLMTSGVVLTDQVKWLSFHSGYDFGYMLKILTNTNLPADEADFFELLRIYFPNIYDVKYLMKSCKNLKGGLQEVAQQLEIPRVGPQHQAGSDSLLTGAAFFNMREMFFEDNIDDAKYCGHLYGLGNSYVVNGSGNGASSNNGNNGGSNINTNNGNNNSSSNNNGSSFENHNSGASSASNGDSSNTQNSSS